MVGHRFTLERLFWKIGYSIGSHPSFYVLFSLALSTLSLGMYNMRVENRVRDGYTPSTSPSIQETKMLLEFMHSIGGPSLTMVILRARDGGSMHRLSYLNETCMIKKYLMNNLTARIPETDQIIRFKHICNHDGCDHNIIIDFYYYHVYDEFVKRKKNPIEQQKPAFTYPIFNYFDATVHLERNFYGVELRKTTSGNDVLTENGNLTDDQLIDVITNITHMKALGTEIVNNELMNESLRMRPHLIAGFIIMFAVAAGSVWGRSLVHRSMTVSKLIIVFGIIICPVLAVTVTFGLSTITNFRINSVTFIMPFLVMGIGVNDAFLLIHCWEKTIIKCSTANRFGCILEQSGPSMTMSTVTNLVTFSIGGLTPTPEISLFCFQTATALVLSYLFTITLLTPILCYISEIRCATIDGSAESEAKRRYLLPVLRLYCYTLTSNLFKCFFVIGWLTYCVFGVIGLIRMKTHLEVRKLLPGDSTAQKPMTIIQNLVWHEYYPLTVIVNSPFDIRNLKTVARFYAMIDEFESFKQCRGKNYTMLWLREYEKFSKEVKELKTIETDFEFALLRDSSQSTNLDFKLLPDFLASPFYAHWSHLIQFTNWTSDHQPLKKFIVLVIYQHTTSWELRVELMQRWRTIANSYSDLNVSVWEPNSLFIDQVLSLKEITLQTLVTTLICMAVICALFIRNPFSVFIATLIIASISFGVIGFLSWWNLDLDPASLCAILMCIGMSVDFVAHVTYHYQLGEKIVETGDTVVIKSLESINERLEHALSSVTWPNLQGGISTVACILPLAALKSYVPSVFVKTTTLVVIWGLFHGLVLLPSFLTVVPIKLLQYKCISSETFVGRSRNKRKSGTVVVEEQMVWPESGSESRKSFYKSKTSEEIANGLAGSANAESRSKPNSDTSDSPIDSMKPRKAH